MQGTLEILVFIGLAIMASFFAYWMGKRTNRTSFYKNLESGQNVLGCLETHQGAFNWMWYFTAIISYVVIAVALSFFPEELHFDFDRARLIPIALGIGFVAFVICFYALKRIDSAPPIPSRSKE